MKKTEDKKTVVKSTAQKTVAAKPDAVKTSTEKAAPAKKSPAKAASKPAVKSAAKKTAAKETGARSAAKRTSSAKTAKSTAAAAKTPAKKPGRKSKPITIDTICTLVEKKAGKPKFKDNIAVDIEVWGFEDGSNHKMYIELKDGNVSVMPHPYNEKDFRVSLSFANAVDFAKGKITLAKLIESDDFYAEGNIVSAIKLATIFK